MPHPHPRRAFTDRHLGGVADTAALQLGRREAQLDLLARVLAAAEEEGAPEDLPEADGLPRQAASQVVARRSKGSMSALTGADGRTYMVSLPACLPVLGLAWLGCLGKACG